jgi:hypothetical protein
MAARKMNTHFVKITAGERARLNRLWAQTHGRLLRSLNAFLARTQSDETLRRVIDLLERNNVEGVMNLIDQHVAVLGNEIPNRWRDVASAEAADLGDRLQEQFPDTLSAGIGFNPTNEEAARLMAANRLEFVTEYGRKQRDVTREALVDALRTGLGPRAAAVKFRDTMGLTQLMYRTVNNYMQILQSLSPEALSRDLRDRRFDRTVESAIANRTMLSKEQIDRMVTRYRDRMKMWRSEMIARTETSKVLGQARQEAQRQVHAQAGIPDAWVRRQWNTTLDGRERDTHHEMDGQQIEGMNSRYQSPSGAQLRYPGDPLAPAAEIVNCRCTESISYLPPSARS